MDWSKNHLRPTLTEMKYIPESRFYWYELPEDSNGLLLDPDRNDFTYGGHTFNPFGGHSTREEAIERFIHNRDCYGYSMPSELVLLEVVKLVKETEND